MKRHEVGKLCDCKACRPTEAKIDSELFERLWAIQNARGSDPWRAEHVATLRLVRAKRFFRVEIEDYEHFGAIDAHCGQIVGYNDVDPQTFPKLRSSTEFKIGSYTPLAVPGSMPVFREALDWEVRENAALVEFHRLRDAKLADDTRQSALTVEAGLVRPGVARNDCYWLNNLRSYLGEYLDLRALVEDWRHAIIAKCSNERGLTIVYGTPCAFIGLTTKRTADEASEYTLIRTGSDEWQSPVERYRAKETPKTRYKLPPAKRDKRRVSAAQIAAQNKRQGAEVRNWVADVENILTPNDKKMFGALLRATEGAAKHVFTKNPETGKLHREKEKFYIEAHKSDAAMLSAIAHVQSSVRIPSYTYTKKNGEQGVKGSVTVVSLEALSQSVREAEGNETCAETADASDLEAVQHYEPFNAERRIAESLQRLPKVVRPLDVRNLEPEHVERARIMMELWRYEVAKLPDEPTNFSGVRRKVTLSPGNPKIFAAAIRKRKLRFKS